MDFVFKGVDFEKRENEVLLFRFVKLYSYYISGGNFIYNTTKKALDKKFKTIKNEVAYLAEKGANNALSFYLHHTPIEEREELLVKRALAIERKPLKTPEEWEVVAGLHFYDKVYVMINGIDTVEKLHDALAYSWTRFDELENEYFHGRYVDVFTNEKFEKKEFAGVVLSDLGRCKWLLERMKDEAYTDAIRHAQIGYYGRFLQSGDVKDAVCFLEFYQNPYDLYLPKEETKEILGVNFLHGIDGFYSILKSEYKKQRRADLVAKIARKETEKKSALDGFAFARALNILGKEGGFLGCIKFDKLINGDFMKLALKDDKFEAEKVSSK